MRALALAAALILTVACGVLRVESELGLEAAEHAVEHAYRVDDVDSTTRLADLDPIENGSPAYPCWLGDDWSTWVAAVYLWEVHQVYYCDLPDDPTVGDLARCPRGTG